MTDETEIKDPAGLLAAYDKAKADLVELRNAKKALEEELAAAKAIEPDEAVEKWRSRALNQAVKAAIEKEGVKNADRIMKLLDLDGVGFDDDDNLTGFDGKVDSVKTDFPELFDVKRRAGRQSVDIHPAPAPEVKKTGTQAQVEALFANR